MLKALRNGANTFAIKLLLIALAAMFVAWGIGDVLRGISSEQSVVTVGGKEISAADYNSILRRVIRNYEQRMGTSLSDAQISAFGIRNQVLNEMIESELISQKIRDIKLSVGNKTIRGELIGNRAFHNEEGKFDQAVFRTVLARHGLNESQFIFSMKDDISKEILFDALAVAPVEVHDQSKLLYKYKNEKRFADVVTLPLSLIKDKDIGEAEESQLVQFYQENQKLFEVPEFRSVSYTIFDFDSVEKVDVSEEEILAEYEAQKDLFRVAEQRKVTQYLFDSEDLAKEIYSKEKSKDKLSKGEMRDLGNITEESLPPEMASSIFALEENVYSEPIESPLGWHVFYVSEIIKPYVKSLSEVKDSLAEELKQNKKMTSFYELVNQIEDELAAGVVLEDIAKKFDLITHNIAAIDNLGNGKSGNQIKSLPEADILVPLAFSVDQGIESPLTILSDNKTYLLLRVNDITEERIKALDEVKGVVISMWKKEAKKLKLKEVANNFADSARKDGSFNVIASDLGLKINKSQKFDRPEKSSSIFLSNGVQGMKEEIFSINKGEITSAYMNEKNEYQVARLNKIEQVNKIDEEGIISLKQDIRDDIVNELLLQYSAKLHKEYPVSSVNQAILNPVIESVE